MKTTPKDIIHVGILGCGAVAHRWYLPGLTKNNTKYRVVAVADIDKTRAQDAAKQYKIENWYENIESLTKHPNLDIVVVLLRHQDHVKAIKYLLEHNLHVYSEKPLAPSAQETRELIALAKKQNKRLCAAPQVMLSARNQTVKKLLENKILGKLSLVRASCSNLGPAHRSDTKHDPKWFYQDGGSMHSLGIYTLATSIYFFGQPKIVSGFSGIAFPERIVEYGPTAGQKIQVTAPDNEVSLFAYENNMYCLLDGTYTVPTPAAYEFEIHGEKGSIFVGGFGGPESVRLKLREKEEQLVGPPAEAHATWTLAWGVEEMIEAIITNRIAKTDASFALSVIEVMDAIRESQKKQEHITL